MSMRKLKTNSSVALQIEAESQVQHRKVVDPPIDYL